MPTRSRQFFDAEIAALGKFRGGLGASGLCAQDAVMHPERDGAAYRRSRLRSRFDQTHAIRGARHQFLLISLIDDVACLIAAPVEYSPAPANFLLAG